MTEYGRGNPCGKRRRSNPTLMLVTANPPKGAEALAAERWCKFHQRDEFDGKRTSMERVQGGPEIVFALGKCVAIDLGRGEQDWTGVVPMLCYDPADEALWILSPSSPLNVGPAKGSRVRAIVYDPVETSGKEEGAVYHHSFSQPLPTLTPVGHPKRCRAILLAGGRYTTSDWIYD